MKHLERHEESELRITGNAERFGEGGKSVS